MCREGRLYYKTSTSTRVQGPRSWKVMENTPQKVLENLGKSPEMFRANPDIITSNHKPARRV